LIRHATDVSIAATAGRIQPPVRIIEGGETLTEADQSGEAGDEKASPGDLLSRRGFLSQGAVLVGGVTLLASPSAQASTLARSAREAAAPGALSSSQVATLKAALARLLPKDELGPGAVEMGVHTYINGALKVAYRAQLPIYRSLLATLDKVATGKGGKSFATLPAAKQDAVLAAVEAGKSGGPQAAGAFQVLLEHMREGAFADPMYGGNASGTGWKLIGYPGIQLVALAKNQEIGTKVEPTHKTARSYGGKPFNGPAID
jgi:gluconate 2-dehydrogenase gamma chain